MRRTADLFEELSPRTAFLVAAFSVSAIFGQALIAFCMGFQPGWANGWPGISKHSVFAAVMSAFLFMMLMSAGFAVFVIPCAYLERTVKRKFTWWRGFPLGWRAVALFTLGFSLLAAFLSLSAFPVIRASVATEWR